MICRRWIPQKLFKFISNVREKWNVPFRELEGFVRKLSEFSSGY
ncbi:MAG: hypothetical protein QXQ46_06830 [Thermoplasmatales archaeon]